MDARKEPRDARKGAREGHSWMLGVMRDRMMI